MNSVSASAAQPWFEACGWTAGYVILHYIAGNNTQQNVNMSYDSNTSNWEYTINNMTSGETLQYSFTYQKSGLQYDTGSYMWTHP